VTAVRKKGLASLAAETRLGSFPGCQKKSFGDKVLLAICPPGVWPGRFLPVKDRAGAAKAAKPID
jgi:hypothetical protein